MSQCDLPNIDAQALNQIQKDRSPLRRKAKKALYICEKYSLPLILGVVVALIWINISPASYNQAVYGEYLGGKNLHYVINDIFMVFFFGIATVEIVNGFLPGGQLNPIKKAVNPVLATLGGVAGPALLYLGLNAVIGSPDYVNGWGIVTATDIALSWMVARIIFGERHPIICFLLLLAVLDDALGLAIIAIFYPDPANPVQPIFLLLVLAGMLIALILRKKDVRPYWLYLILGGIPSWIGLSLAHLHPALALVFIIPFLPHNVSKKKDRPGISYSPLIRFPIHFNHFIVFGLFFFAITNAGVPFSAIGIPTLLVFVALLLGKCLGIFGMSTLANTIGFPFPDGVTKKEIFLVGIVAGMGLTVALFIAAAAFVEPTIQSSAKMGALFSSAAFVIAFIAAKAMNIRKID
jgi:NhaA family Na+:H+ antiporter